jgi:hypothetical protein
MSASPARLDLAAVCFSAIDPVGNKKERVPAGAHSQNIFSSNKREAMRNQQRQRYAMPPK